MTPQLENGYIKIANEIMEAMISRPELMRGALFPIIAVVWRKTYGWNKKEDAISISQFMEMTGYSKRTVIYTIQELEAKRVLKVQRGCKGQLKETNIFSFNKNYKEWVVQNSADQVKRNRGSAKLRKRVVQNSVKKVKSFAHTKDTTKDNTKDNIEPSSNNQKIMSFKNQKRYNENRQWEEETIDAESGELFVAGDATNLAEKELNQKIRHNLKLVEEARGLPFGSGADINYHVKIYRALLKLGWTHETLVKGFLEIINSDYWKERKKMGQYPGMNTVQSLLRNKQPK